MIQGIILAAGRGSRLGHLTEKKPKSFNKSGNKRYIDIVIKNFKENNINDINIIVGYKRKLFNKFPQKIIVNDKWKSTNIFYSLSKASKILKKNTCIVSYSDIIYDKKALKLLLKEKGDIVIINNKNWKKIWQMRFENPLDDLESFNYIKTASGKYLTQIGGKVKSIASVKGQFAGLFKISPKGWKRILIFNKECKIDIYKEDITSFFSKFLKKNKKIIKVVDYDKDWFEIDTLNDLKNYKIYRERI